MALTLGDNFSYQGAKPLDARLIYSTVASMKAVADSTMYDGCMAYCTATSKTYQWKSTNAVDETTGKWREFSSGGDTIQVDTLPTAGADELGNVYQYIGSTTLTLTHGYFYECVSDGESTPTYSWSQVEVSKGGHDIKNNGVAVTSRDTMNFTDFDIADDSTNEETDVKAHRLTASELTDICTPLPGAVSDMPVLFDETGAEYVVGWYKLANGTKKPVYEKHLVLLNQTNINDTTVDIAENVDILISKEITGFRKTDVAKNPVYIPYVANTTTNYDNYILSGFFKDLNSNNNKLIWQWQVGATQDGRTHDFYITVRYTKTTDTPV